MIQELLQWIFPAEFSRTTLESVLGCRSGDSAGIGLVFAAALMESETTQLAPAKAMQIALPAQLKWLRGSADSFGIQTSNSKITISAVIAKPAREKEAYLAYLTFSAFLFGNEGDL